MMATVDENTAPQVSTNVGQADTLLSKVSPCKADALFSKLASPRKANALFAKMASPARAPAHARVMPSPLRKVDVIFSDPAPVDENTAPTLSKVTAMEPPAGQDETSQIIEKALEPESSPSKLAMLQMNMNSLLERGQKLLIRMSPNKADTPVAEDNSVMDSSQAEISESVAVVENPVFESMMEVDLASESEGAFFAEMTVAGEYSAPLSPNAPVPGTLAEALFPECAPSQDEAKRGQKRSAASALLSEIHEVDEAITAEEPCSAVDVLPDYEEAVMAESDSPAESLETTLNPNCEVPFIEAARPFEEFEPAPQVENQLAGSSPACRVNELEATPQTSFQDSESEFASPINDLEATFQDAAVDLEPQVTLSAYKTIVDAQTDLQDVEGDEVDDSTAVMNGNVEWQDPTSGAILGYAECDDEEALEPQASATDQEPSNIEWQDPTSGAILGYAECNDCDVENAVEPQTHATDKDPMSADSTEVALAEDDIVSAESLQITVEWQEPSTGAMMGYALCDEDDKDVQAMQQLFEEQEEQDDLAQKSGAECDAPSVPDEGSAKSSEEQQYQEGEQLSEWQEPATGALLGYAVDVDSEDDAEVAQMDVEWKDPNTGALLAYAYDEESELGEEYETTSVASADLQDVPRATRKCHRRVQAFRPTVLRVRDLHLKRVLKSFRARK